MITYETRSKATATSGLKGRSVRQGIRNVPSQAVKACFRILFQSSGGSLPSGDMAHIFASCLSLQSRHVSLVWNFLTYHAAIAGGAGRAIPAPKKASKSEFTKVDGSLGENIVRNVLHKYTYSKSDHEANSRSTLSECGLCFSGHSHGHGARGDFCDIRQRCYSDIFRGKTHFAVWRTKAFFN